MCKYIGGRKWFCETRRFWPCNGFQGYEFHPSVNWMAPEVVRGRGTHGLPADIWSLGCTLLEMLTRRYPFSNFEAMEALYRIGRGERPDIPASISSNARDFILECLQVDPSLRPTAAELLDHPFVNPPLTIMEPSTHHFDRNLFDHIIN